MGKKQKITDTEASTATKAAFSYRPSRIVLFVILLAVIILSVFGYIYYQSHSHVIFSVSGKNYTQSDVRKLTSFATGKGARLDESSFQLYGWLKDKSAANKTGIKIDQKQINEIAKKTITNDKDQTKALNDPWVQLSTYDSLLQQKIVDTKSKIEGYSLILWFGQHLESGPRYRAANYGDAKLIASDRAYAQQKASFYREQIVSHKLSPEQAIKAIKSDPKLSYGYDTGADSNQSTQFSSSDESDLRTKLFFEEPYNYIHSQKSAGISKVMTGKISTIEFPESPTDYADGYFYIEDVTKYVPSLKNTYDEK